MSSPSSCSILKPPKKVDWGGALHPRKILALPPLFCLMWRILWAKLNSSDKAPIDDTWAKGVIRKFDGKYYTLVMFLPDEGFRHYLHALYLVLRIADTIEDDTGKSAATRRADLATIHRFLDDPNYQPSCDYGVNPRELDLMRSLANVRSYCKQLSPSSLSFISECCSSMCEGMAEFLPDESCDSAIKDFHELELYCYIAGGLFHNCISRFYVAQGYESEDILPTKTPSTGNSDWAEDYGWTMFVQQSHIIEDVAEDTFASPQPRLYWPKSLVQKYVKEQRELFLPENEQLALDCLNEFIIHTLRHIVPLLRSHAKHKYSLHVNIQVGPFLYVLTTMALYYNNPDVFKFKLRSNLIELACAVGNSQDFEGLVQQTKMYCRKFLEKSGPKDKHGFELEKAVNLILSGCDILLRKERREKSVKIFNSSDIFWWCLVFFCALYCFMYFPSKC